MIEHQNSKPEHLAEDPYFCQWVTDPNPSNNAFWQAWLKKHPEKRSVAEEASALVLLLKFKEDEIPDKAIERIRTHVAAGVEQEDSITSLPTETAGSRSRVWLKVAAAVTLAFVVGIWLVISQPFKTRPVVQTSAPEYIEKFAPIGTKSTIVLSDGTRVKLNANTKIVYPSTFAPTAREVVLKGEAYFEVAEDVQKPFIIYTGEIITTVLGTSFNIGAYPNSGEIKVAVASGKVSVSRSINNKNEETTGLSPLVLEPNEMAVYSKGDEMIGKESFDPKRVFGWKDGLIYFQKASFNEVVETLEQWYGVTFILESNIDTRKDFNGSYQDKPLSTVLEGLSFAYDFQYQIKGKIVIIQ